MENSGELSMNSSIPTKKPFKCVIITRYNEKIDWISYIIDFVDQIIVYNKGTNDNMFKEPNNSPKITIQRLPNIGRIDHTIAYHILQHWDNLPDTLISLPGSILMCMKKGYYLNSMRRRFDSLDHYNGFYSPRFHKVNPNTYNYTIDNYQAEGACNRNTNPFIKSEYPDFRTWKEAIIDSEPIRYLGMRGMFMVSKENVKHIDRSIYENLLTSLSVGDNIENGHFAERIWAHLFRQYSTDKFKNIILSHQVQLSQFITPNSFKETVSQINKELDENNKRLEQIELEMENNNRVISENSEIIQLADKQIRILKRGEKL
jgi:hypothetical protein